LEMMKSNGVDPTDAGGSVRQLHCPITLWPLAG
jgi:hypothetical protein